MPTIRLTNTHELVELDEIDIPKVRDYRWFKDAYGQVTRRSTQAERAQGSPQRTLIYRQILNLKTGVVIHYDKNKLNNKRDNLVVQARNKAIRFWRASPSTEYRKAHNKSGYPNIHQSGNNPNHYRVVYTDPVDKKRRSKSFKSLDQAIDKAKELNLF